MKDLDFSAVDLILENAKSKLDALASEYNSKNQKHDRHIRKLAAIGALRSAHAMGVLYAAGLL